MLLCRVARPARAIRPEHPRLIKHPLKTLGQLTLLLNIITLRALEPENGDCNDKLTEIT